MLWILIILTAVAHAQIPIFSSLAPLHEGCKDLEDEIWRLGMSGGRSGRDGLVALSLKLHYAAGLNFPGPIVEIFSVVTTCRSSTRFRNDRFSTTTVLVDYSCANFLCLEGLEVISSPRRFIRQFAFVCQGNGFRAYDTLNVNTLPAVVDVFPTNPIYGATRIAPYGTCRLCAIIPPGNRGSLSTGYDPVTGCVSKYVYETIWWGAWDSYLNEASGNIFHIRCQ